MRSINTIGLFVIDEYDDVWHEADDGRMTFIIPYARMTGIGKRIVGKRGFIKLPPLTEEE